MNKIEILEEILKKHNIGHYISSYEHYNKNLTLKFVRDKLEIGEEIYFYAFPKTLQTSPNNLYLISNELTTKGIQNSLIQEKIKREKYWVGYVQFEDLISGKEMNIEEKVISINHNKFKRIYTFLLYPNSEFAFDSHKTGKNTFSIPLKF